MDNDNTLTAKLIQMKAMKFIPSYIIPGTKEYYLFKISNKNQTIYLTLVILIIAIITSLPLIYVDVMVSSYGIITTNIENQAIISPTEGFVKYSRIKSNEKVRTGDTLLIIDSKALDVQFHYLILRQKENNKSIGDLKNLITLDSISLFSKSVKLKSSRYIAEYNSFKSKYINHLNSFNNKLTEHKRIEYLYFSKVISSSKYEASLFELNQKTATLNYLILEQVNTWEKDLATRLYKQTKTKAEISHLKKELKKRYIIAPVDGTIIISSDIQKGSFLSLNQKIAELSPEGSLIVTTMVKPMNVGYLHNGQEIRVQVDAYNYNQWGVLDAFIYDISDDIIISPSGNEPFYRVRCKLLNDTLIHRNGSVGKPKKGMTVNCLFFQTRESLFNLLIKQTDYWINPTSQ